MRFTKRRPLLTPRSLVAGEQPSHAFLCVSLETGESAVVCVTPREATTNQQRIWKSRLNGLIGRTWT